MCSLDCMDCKNELNLCKLCVKKAVIRHLCSDHIKSEEICSPFIEAVQLNVEQGVVNNICVAGKVSAGNISSLSLNANNLCAQNGVINRLCVNDISIGSAVYCQKYRALATSSASFSYGLGSNINWNMVLDDPNNNVSLAPFSYTVPVSGYYSATFHLDVQNLMGAIPITGVPIGKLIISINNSFIREQYSPFLSFSSSNTSTLSGIFVLNAGDIIRNSFEILVIDPAAGVQSYIGTVDIICNGQLPGDAGFSIHYLSSLNCTPVMCQPCPPVELPCQPVVISCDSDSECHSCNKTNPIQHAEDKSKQPEPVSPMDLREQRRLQRERDRK